MKKLVLLLILVLPLFAGAQEFNGYVQLRSQASIRDYSFYLRRLKLWVKSDSVLSSAWGYKIQTTISSKQGEKFFLQDVYLTYKYKNLKLKIGQLVPRYGLQRFQHDYVLDILERSPAVNYLIPDGTLGVRDLGAQIKYNYGAFDLWFGYFAGRGIDYSVLQYGDYLITNSMQLKAHNVKLGCSVALRHATNLNIPVLLPDSVSFSGYDRRADLFFFYKLPSFEFGAEYLYASLNQQIFSGYYLYSSLLFSEYSLSAIYSEYFDHQNDFGVYFTRRFRSWKRKLTIGLVRNQDKKWSIQLQYQLFLF